MTADYGTPQSSPLHHEPGAPVPAVIQAPPEPPSRLQLTVAGVAAVGAASAGAMVGSVLAVHGAYGYATIVTIGALVGVVEAVRAGVRPVQVEVPDAPMTERERIFKMLKDGRVTEYEAVRLLKVAQPDPPKAP